MPNTNQIPNQDELNAQLAKPLRDFVEEYGAQELEDTLFQVYEDHLRTCAVECPPHEDFTFFLVRNLVKIIRQAEATIVNFKKAA